MSSEISTRAAAATSADTAAGKDQGLQAWQFFVLAALGCATAATLITRGQGITTVVLLSVLMAGAAFVGLTALRTIQPLVSDHDDRVEMLGRRTRAALERDKLLTLRAIKELEFDRAMGKLSEDDFKEMAGRLRTRAARLMRQLDAGAGYREQIERDLEKKMIPFTRDAKDTKVAKAVGTFCTQCGVSNDSDAKFCKSCGTKL
jgi:zinc-ribbon domain